MASLRRKPAPDVGIDADIADPVAVTIDTNQPEPLPAPHDDGAANALRGQLQALRNSESLAQEAQRQAAIAAEAEQRRTLWLSQNRQAQENYSELDGIHQHALRAGLLDTSPAYFEFLNSQLEALQAHRPEHLVAEMKTRVEQHRPPEPQPPSRGHYVSAPVSRDVPSGYSSPSRIRLTRDQCETARLAGISESEYAAQLIKLNEMKANGDYSERR